MKKLISLVLILCMACMLVPATAEDVTGDWYLKTMKQGETEYDAGSIGYNISMTLNADGTGTMLTPTSEEPLSGSWTLEDGKITITFDNSPIEGTVADGAISLAEGEQTMIFTREAGQAIQLAEVNPAAAAEEYEGDWTVKYVGIAGMTIDASLSPEPMPSANITDGGLKFVGEGSLGQMFGENALPLTYADGAMSFSLTMGETSIEIKAEMLQDGMMALSVIMGDTVTSLYFVKAEAAEEPAA